MFVLKFGKPKSEGEVDGIVSVVVRCTSPWPSTEEIEIAATAALGWQGSIARMLDGSDMDESKSVRTLRFERYYEWTVKMRVAATWVADGFNLDKERAEEMLKQDLRSAYGHEMEAEIVQAPPLDDIAREQGYKSASDPKFSAA